VVGDRVVEPSCDDRQVTDASLLALARASGGRFVTVERSCPTTPASSELVRQREGERAEHQDDLPSAPHVLAAHVVFEDNVTEIVTAALSFDRRSTPAVSGAVSAAITGAGRRI
jgi:hypothetical protein